MIQIRPSTSFDPHLMFSDVKDDVIFMDDPVWECENEEDVGEFCKGLDMTDVGLIWK